MAEGVNHTGESMRLCRASRMPQRMCKAVFLLAALWAVAEWHAVAQQAPAPPLCAAAQTDTASIPIDSAIYPALLRLYSLGYIDSVFITERPWTRASVGKMLDEVADKLETAQNARKDSYDEAQRLYQALLGDLQYSPAQSCLLRQKNLHIDTVYSSTRVLTGTPLRDSMHLGQTIINDYGRPYANGVNNYSGFSSTATAGRFLVYLRGEFQATPDSTGYNPSLAQYLSETVDLLTYQNPATGVPYYQATIPQGAIAGKRSFNSLEAYISTELWKHQISFGRKDAWLSPAQGGAFAYSNNAENLYALHIDRQQSLYVPGLSRLVGPFRYAFMVGEVQGHTTMAASQHTPGSIINWVNPGRPWMHLEVISFKPSSNLELSFERTVIWGGQKHEGISLHSFLRSFFSVTAPGSAQKNSNRDPGSRYGAFNLSYRLPYLRDWITLYSDAEVHDDLCACDAPHRASWRPGLYLVRFPFAPHLDLRVEAVMTDPPVASSQGGKFMYWEGMDRQGYTNRGQIFGDWIGREAKGGQAWLTYYIRGNEWVQLSYRNQKAASDFIVGGTTLNDFGLQMVKRIHKDFELRGSFFQELWKAPVYRSGLQNVTTTTLQLTWFPPKI